jgi:2-polyprenyl-3-methyl-5-hydroxy-6-metoxy-1,4-benzoquinol methylase
MAVAVGLFDYRPPPTPTVNQWRERYESGGWDYLGSVYQLAHYSLLAGYLEFYRCRSILDVGCGSGLLRSRMTGTAFDRYVGIDPVPAAIDRAQGLADARTTFVVGDVFSCELTQFDAVVCNEVLYCVPEPDRILDRARTLITPGGYFMTSNMRHPGDAGLRRLIAERFELIVAADITNDSDRGRHRRQVAVYTTN